MASKRYLTCRHSLGSVSPPENPHATAARVCELLLRSLSSPGCRTKCESVTRVCAVLCLFSIPVVSVKGPRSLLDPASQLAHKLFLHCAATSPVYTTVSISSS